ncbi:MAG: J domain-containing protein [Candidatus Micrarchaeota archaeon]|nr:J domain-containing protein [Candidatus Micrarchaeota archaeon]
MAVGPSASGGSRGGQGGRYRGPRGPGAGSGPSNQSGVSATKVISLPDFSGKDAYQVLGVPMNASPAEIKDAFKGLALKYHPDKAKGIDTTRTMKAINKAYEMLGRGRDDLKSIETRRKYNSSPTKYDSWGI